MKPLSLKSLLISLLGKLFFLKSPRHAIQGLSQLSHCSLPHKVAFSQFLSATTSIILYESTKGNVDNYQLVDRLYYNV